MIVTTDKITTTANTVTAISALLAANGVSPWYLGLLATVSHCVAGYYTNKGQ